MGLTRTKIIWVKNGTTAEVDVTDFIRVNLSKGLNKKNNSGDILLKNDFGSWVDNVTEEFMIGEGDVIKVYAKMVDDNTSIDTSVGSSDLLMVSEVTGWGVKSGEKGDFWKVDFVDKTSLILNQLWGKVYFAKDGWTAPLIIQHAINHVVNQPTITNVEVPFVSYPSRNGIQQTRPDGSAFPDISTTKVWKPLVEWLDDLSQPKNTNYEDELSGSLVAQKSYVYYVDAFNKLHWFYPDSDVIDWTTDSNLSWYAGDGVSGSPVDVKENSNSLTKKVFEVINTVFFRCGKDMYNNGISWYHFDPSSKTTGINAKQVFRPYTKIAEDLKRDEFVFGNITFDKTNNVWKFPTSYPITMSWTIDGSSVIVNDDGEYNDAFRERCKAIGTRNAQALTQKRGSPRYKGKIELSGYAFTQGQFINYSNVSAGIKNELLRITDINHSIEKDGWFTTLTVEEDEPAIGV